MVATDDMAVTSKRSEDAEMFKKNIKKFWDITNNRLIGWFLGFQIKRDRRNKTLSINQHAYLESLAEKFRLTHAKPVKTPIEPGTQYSKEQSLLTPNQVAKMRGVPYNEASHHIETGYCIHSWCYDFSPTHVEHTFSFLHGDNSTLAATCADGSYFISALLLT